MNIIKKGCGNLVKIALVKYDLKYLTTKKTLGIGPYYKSKLELKSNSSEILPVNCKFIFFRFNLE